MTLKEKFVRARYPLLFLALLIPAIAVQRVAAEDQPGADHVLIVDVYSGAIAPDGTLEKAFWLWLESLNKTEEGSMLPKVIHIEHALLGGDFEIAEQGNANGVKVVVQGHVSAQGDGKFRIAFSELGPRTGAYSGATELTLAPGERRVLRLPVMTQSDVQGNLETVTVIWIPALAKDQNGPLAL